MLVEQKFFHIEKNNVWLGLTKATNNSYLSVKSESPINFKKMTEVKQTHWGFLKWELASLKEGGRKLKGWTKGQ